MAKSQKQIEARKLRRKGLSLNEIVKKLKVSKSSVSLWCSGIELSEKQKLRLNEKIKKGSYSGRMIGARMQKDRKRKNIENCRIEAEKEIGLLTDRDLLIAGVALYWGEGTKVSSDVRFCNSNAELVIFAMKWMRQSLHVSESEFMMYVGINELHKDRLMEVVEYWSKVTRVPIEQFRKPTLFKVGNKKIYENFANYYGTITIRVAKSSKLLYKILGLIEALK